MFGPSCFGSNWSLNQFDHRNLAPLIHPTRTSHQALLLYVFCPFRGLGQHFITCWIMRRFAYILTEKCQNSLVLFFHLIPLSERNSHCLESRLLLLVTLFLFRFGKAIIFLTEKMLRMSDICRLTWTWQVSASSSSTRSTGSVLSDILWKIVEIDNGKRAIPLPEARSAFWEKESASESLEKRPKRPLETDFREGPDGGR